MYYLCPLLYTNHPRVRTNHASLVQQTTRRPNITLVSTPSNKLRGCVLHPSHTRFLCVVVCEKKNRYCITPLVILDKARQYDHCLTRYRRGMKDRMNTASTRPHLTTSMAVPLLPRRIGTLRCPRKAEREGRRGGGEEGGLIRYSHNWVRSEQCQCHR